MENFLIRTAETSGASKPTLRDAKATHSSGGFQDSFKDFMRKVGSSAGNGINVAVNNSPIGKIEERSDQGLNRGERDSNRQDHDNSGDYRSQAERSDAGGRDDSHNDLPPAERYDNVSERGKSARDEGLGDGRASRADNPPDSSENTGNAPPTVEPEDASKASDDAPANPDQTANHKTDDEGPAKGQDSADKNETSSKKSAKSDSEDVTVVADMAVIANIAVATNNADKVLVSPKESSQVNRSGENDKGNVAELILGQEALKTKGKGKAKNTAANANKNAAANVGTRPNGKAMAGVKASDTAKANASANSGLNNQARAGADIDPDFKVRLAQQAAGISKAVGKGGPLEVSVNVAKESDTLVSRPSSTLVLQSSTGNKNDKSSGNGKSSASTAKNAVNQAAQQLKEGAAQGLDQQTKPQASRFQSEVIGQGKGQSQGTAQSGPNSQPVVSGGDAPSVAGPGGTAESAHTQQSAAAKAATPRQAALARQPVVDQVSVQITKAIAAGADKINIQLRPSSLGRIEVSLEVTKSGHVSAVVIADNKNTLDLLQNGSEDLKQALQDAGLNTDSGNLDFSLRGENHMADAGNGGRGLSAGNEGLMDDDDNAGAGGGQFDPRDVNIITNSRVDVRA